jgi:hypothetical protein
MNSKPSSTSATSTPLPSGGGNGNSSGSGSGNGVMLPLAAKILSDRKLARQTFAISVNAILVCSYHESSINDPFSQLNSSDRHMSLLQLI